MIGPVDAAHGALRSEARLCSFLSDFSRLVNGFVSRNADRWPSSTLFEQIDLLACFPVSWWFRDQRLPAAEWFERPSTVAPPSFCARYSQSRLKRYECRGGGCGDCVSSHRTVRSVRL